jgi:ketosteroid isomerase-like protein
VDSGGRIIRAFTVSLLLELVIELWNGESSTSNSSDNNQNDVVREAKRSIRQTELSSRIRASPSCFFIWRLDFTVIAPGSYKPIRKLGVESPQIFNLPILVVEDHANTLRRFARLLDHFGMKIRSLFVCSAVLLFASVAYGAGSYQRTRDGKTLVWNDSPKRAEEATWSGKRDKNGFAAGSGTLTWYKVEPTIVTGSNIPDARRHAVVINRYLGKMVQGKFEGAVTYVDANGKRLQPTFVKGRKRPGTQQTALPTPERTPAPAAQETPTAVPQQTATLAPQQTATRTSEQQTRQPDAKSIIVAVPTPPDDSLRSRTAAPLALPKPPPTVDAQTVASLDTVYHAAVKANDTAIMDRILDDDFVLITDRGATLTKADLIKEAREKRTIYEQQEEQEGTQKVRVWRDTAVVTELLRIKGVRDQNPFDYKVWVTETYVRTATGWQYVFGQAVPWPQPDAK